MHFLQHIKLGIVAIRQTTNIPKKLAIKLCLSVIFTLDDINVNQNSPLQW